MSLLGAEREWVTGVSLSFPSTGLGFHSLGHTRSLIETADFRAGVGKVQDEPGTSYCAKINQSINQCSWCHGDMSRVSLKGLSVTKSEHQNNDSDTIQRIKYVNMSLYRYK